MSKTTRREFLVEAALAGAGLALTPRALAISQANSPVEPDPVHLRWLGEQHPLLPIGVAWGVPWLRGAMAKGRPVTVRDGSGAEIPAQTWPLAYWPDGSIKWTGVAIAANAAMADVTIAASDSPSPRPSTAVVVSDDATGITVNTGPLSARISRTGSSLIASLRCEDREIARDGRLIALREDRSRYEDDGVLREEQYYSTITDAIVEQSGPVRAVVYLKGMHRGSREPAREWLPFSVRFYFTAGLASIRMVHSFVYDGQQNTDFIKGIGLAFAVPFREEIQNRHVRFATDGDNLYAEPLLMAPGYRPGVMQNAVAYEAAQLKGQRIPNLADLPEQSRKSILNTATWDGFKLRQLNSDGWELFKRTSNKSTWLHITNGNRARGLAFLGDVSGGLAIGVKRFWQKYPAAFEITNASTPAGEFKVWFWSPDAPAMDMRHYDTVAHELGVTYEDPRSADRADAYGCANTAELTLWATPNTPAAEDLDAMTKTGNEPPLLVCLPQHYYDTKTLGVWSLPGVPTPGLTAAEVASADTQLDRAFAFYHGEVERRRWYGFWDYGDFRRTYDPIRHQWMYDIGGHGWNASELVPNVWLWFAFLRSGRADIFRAVEDMTRNISEVDVYHIGRFAGVGSRHNVSHWGDGAKEPRLSEAFLKRFYYYLTTDERTGDLLREPLSTAETTIGLYLNQAPSKGNEIALRFGPDWEALASNWLTEWERTGDLKYRDYCLNGMRDFGAMTERDFAGNAFYLEPTGKHVRPRGAFNNQTQFLFLFAGDQILYEMTSLIDCPEFAKAWDKRCENIILNSQANEYFAARLTAYVAKTTGRRDLEGRAIGMYRGLLKFGGNDFFIPTPNRFDGPGVTQPAWENPGRSTFTPIIATPEVAQWAINLLTMPEWLRSFKANP